MPHITLDLEILIDLKGAYILKKLNFFDCNFLGNLNSGIIKLRDFQNKILILDRLLFLSSTVAKL